MSCPSEEELAMLYDGLLPAKRARPLRRHLAACPRCAQDFKNIDTLLGLRQTTPPNTVSRRVFQQSSNHRNHRGRRSATKSGKRSRTGPRKQL